MSFLRTERNDFLFFVQASYPQASLSPFLEDFGLSFQGLTRAEAVTPGVHVLLGRGLCQKVGLLGSIQVFLKRRANGNVTPCFLKGFFWKRWKDQGRKETGWIFRFCPIYSHIAIVFRETMTGRMWSETAQSARARQLAPSQEVHILLVSPR